MFRENVKKYQVLTPDGFKDFAGVSLMSWSEVWRVELEDGLWLECTHDHKLFGSDENRKPLSEYACGDSLDTKNGYKKILSISNTGMVVPVYDLIEVDGGHRYYANHILSSNCEFIVFDETLISSMKIAKLRSKEPIKRSGQIRWYKRIRSDATYAVVLDPSMGTGGDNAAITIWELPSLEQVGEWRDNRTTVEGQMRVFKDILHDIQSQGDPEIFWTLETNSLGEAALVIIRDTGLENFPGTFVHDRKKDGTNRTKKGFVTTNKSKLEACAKFKQWVESGKMTINSAALIDELKTFVARSNTYIAKQGCYDDLISSTLLFVRLAEVVARWDDEIFESIKGNIMEHEIDESDTDMRFPLPIM